MVVKLCLISVFTPAGAEAGCICSGAARAYQVDANRSLKR